MNIAKPIACIERTQAKRVRTAKRRISYIKQKLAGLLLILLGILSATVEKDGTALLLMFPIGTGLIGSQENFLKNEEEKCND